ncbi:MAG: hypothetical protein ABI678_12150 [Kofleriaceae bacterium]
MPGIDPPPRPARDIGLGRQDQQRHRTSVASAKRRDVQGPGQPLLWIGVQLDLHDHGMRDPVSVAHQGHGVSSIFDGYNLREIDRTQLRAVAWNLDAGTDQKKLAREHGPVPEHLDEHLVIERGHAPHHSKRHAAHNSPSTCARVSEMSGDRTVASRTRTSSVRLQTELDLIHDQ